MKNFVKTPFFRLLLTTAIGLLLYFITPDCLEKKWVIGILATLFLIINTSRWIGKAPIITHIFRIFTGGLFIFSGFIKSNDPTGFSYKLKEYFEVFKADFEDMSDHRPDIIANIKKSPALSKSIANYTQILEKNPNLFEGQYSSADDVFAAAQKSMNAPVTVMTRMCDYLEHHSLGLAIAVCVSEVALGFMLLIGWLKMFTLFMLLAQIVFFTWLTFYSACYNKVTGCGCFGDFIKLAPWESFWKDIVLLICVTILFAGKDNIQPFFKGWKSPLVTIITVGLAVWFPIFTYRNLPVFDFLPYKNGNDICELQKPGPAHKDAVYMSYFTYKNLKTGQDSLFDQNHMPWQDTLTWKYVSAGETKLISPEIDPAKILGFSIQDLDGNEIKDSLFADKNYYFLLICHNLGETEKNPELTTRLNAFYDATRKEKINFLAVSSASHEEISVYKHELQAMYEFGTADGVMLKTMIRSNPGLMLMQGCKVVKKWHYNNLPEFSKVKEEYFK